jgi:DNA-binding NarL/FixJ family response regulator
VSKIKVFVVDDAEIHLEGMRHLIGREEDMELVGVAKTGESAIPLIHELKPDVLVLDMNLGRGMSGIDVARVFKDKPDRPRILALSEYNSRTYIFGVLDQGADGYLLKSESLAQIAAGIRGVYSKEEWWYSREVVALISKRSQGQDDKQDKLSPREREVLRLFGWGMSDKKIASRLGCATSTAHNHREKIYSKLGLKNMGEAAAWAWSHGYMEDAEEDGKEEDLVGSGASSRAMRST